MNYSSAIFLTNPNAKAVAVSYDIDKVTGHGAAPFYTFKTFETFEVGDYVVVPTNSRHGMTVCRVEKIDVEVEPTSNIDLKWVVGRVDKSVYDETLAREQDMIVKIKSAKARREREKLAEELLADNPELRDMAMLTAPVETAKPAG